MKKKTKYTEGPIEEVKIIRDFLPSPAELAAQDETVKITLTLTKRSVEFFKSEAQQHGTQYQKMIRMLLDDYTWRHM